MVKPAAWSRNALFKIVSTHFTHADYADAYVQSAVFMRIYAGCRAIELLYTYMQPSEFPIFVETLIEIHFIGNTF